MVLIWRGWGILIAPILVLAFFIPVVLFDRFHFLRAFQAQLYIIGLGASDTALWLMIGGAIAALLIFALGIFLKRRYGEENARLRRDGLFFLTVHHWGLLALVTMAAGFALALIS